MDFRLACRATCAVAALLSVAVPAWGHHPTGGKTPSTFIEGLLSGFGHPVIGPDHLAFLIAIGIVVGAGGLPLALPGAFVAAMAAGVAVHAAGIDLPATEIIVALTVVVAGLLLAFGRKLPVALWATLFALAGLAHGYALGETIVGAETTPLAAYLLGLVLVQTALAIGVALMVRRIGAGLAAPVPRLAGAAIVAVGVILLAAQYATGA